MKRIFPSQFHKSYLSMSKDSLQELHSLILSCDQSQDEYTARLLLTSINSLRFKINNPKYTITDLKQMALEEIEKKLEGYVFTPKITQSNSEFTTKITQSNSECPPQSPPVKTKIPPQSPPVKTKIPPEYPPVSKKETHSIPNSLFLTPNSSKDFPSPLIVGPLHHEALHVQELYYLPLAQLHNQLFILVQQAIKQAIALGWQGEDVKTWKPSAATPSLTGRAGEGLSPFAPNAERSSLQQRITKLDNQLQNFWNRYHLALDEINGTEISEETRAQLDKETHACDSPSLSAAVPCDQSQGNKALGSYTKKEILAGLVPQDISLEELITARQDRNKKLLRRRDRQKTEAHKATVLEAATELHEWNIYIEPAQAKTCEYYGITLPQDWLRPVPTEEEKKAAHNESQKRSYSKKTAIQREMKAAFKAEEMAAYPNPPKGREHEDTV